MDVKENGIQLKIDSIILEINQNNTDNQNEEKNQITALMKYSHCIDLFEFLQIFSKIQKNELLVQTALIYDSIGYTELSMDYINESLLLIPNVPSVILYKSGLFASLNKLDEAQKWLLKYKYLIGENIYDNYIHDSFLVIFYYLLDYEEHIILRKINSIENKYSNYVTDNVVIFFIKSKILEKYAQKIKNCDKKRYVSYIKESNEITKRYINNKKTEVEFLFEQGIKSENVTKLLILINPTFLNYKPKKLIEYKKGFNKSGFSLFYTLIKICKKLKLEIEAKKFSKLNKTNNNAQKNELKGINNILKYLEENPEINNLSIEEKEKNCLATIKKLSKSVWLQGIKKNIQTIDVKNIKNTNIVKSNYYIQEGFYSNLNLKRYILKNIEYNKIYKQNKLELNYYLNEETKMENDEEKIEDKKMNNDEHNCNELKIILSNKIIKKNKVNNKEEKIENKNINNNDNAKISKKEIKKGIKKEEVIDSNKIRKKIIKNSLSDIIKKVITNQHKDNNKNKRNKNNEDNKDSKKAKKFCSTDNCISNQIKSQKSQDMYKKKIDIIKIEANTVLNKKSDEEKINQPKREEKEENNNKIKEEIKNDKAQSNKNSNKRVKNCNNKNYLVKKNREKEIKNINVKNKLLTTNSSNKKMTLINSNDRVKPLNKNFYINHGLGLKEEKKLDTDYGKYKEVREINLVSYCLKQLMKKKENKNKNTKQKEFGNLTEKIDLGVPHKIPDLEKQFQINEHKYIQSKSKKKKFVNKSTKKKINTFTFEKKMKKTNQKLSDNNLINSNKSSYVSFNNNNIKNLKRTINNYGNKKELSKFKSLKYLHNNFYSNNNYLNINFNSYMNFNYSNRHDEKKNFDFRFNPNSENKKRENSNSKDKFNFRTINLDFKNMSTKLSSNYIKKPVLNSVIDSKDKNKKSSDNKYDFGLLPFNKIKNSPSSETNCLKKKLKNFKSNLINPKMKTSFSKYIYNINNKADALYFSKSINTSEYSKYKNSSSNKSKGMKNRYNKTTIVNKSNSKNINK